MEPRIYPGPIITVVSQNISSQIFSVDLKLENVTSWGNGHTLDIDSSSAGVVWAYGTNPPTDPGNSASDFQQHLLMGVFSINMKSAQMTSSNPSGPSIINPVDVSTTNILGLTKRDKVDLRKLC